ncbi:hypothetical protein ACU8KH_05374 [Lachancea thermotolerans]
MSLLSASSWLVVSVLEVKMRHDAARLITMKACCAGGRGLTAFSLTHYIKFSHCARL